jgi:F-type H+-transporting ATPase subunit epsilon
VTLTVELVSPERVLYSGQARIVTARTVEGDIAFLTGHAPFIGALGTGVVRIGQVEGGDEVAAVHGGFVEVKADRVTILSDVAELRDQIDVARARAARERAEAAVRADAGDEEAAEALRRAEVRLRVAEG